MEIDRAADRGVHGGAAEFFGIDRLPDGCFHERRAGQAELAAVGHQHLVAQHGQVRAAGDAVAHDGGELRDAGGRHHGVVAKDAAEVVFVGKDFVLQRQEHAGRIDEVNDGQPELRGDPLGSQQFFDRLRKHRAGFHRGVVGGDEARPTADPTDAGNESGGGTSPQSGYMP